MDFLPACQCRDVGSIPDWGPKIPFEVKKPKHKTEANVAINSNKDFEKWSTENLFKKRNRRAVECKGLGN